MTASFAPTRFAVVQLEGRDMMSATFAGATGFSAFAGYRPEAAGTHALYQDITIPGNHSTAGTAVFVGVAAPRGEGKEGVVTIGEINNLPTPQGKAVLHVRKAGGYDGPYY